MDFSGWAAAAGLGGIAFGAITLIFRDAIAKEVLAGLPVGKRYPLLRLIVLCAFILGALGIIAWASDRYWSQIYRAEADRTAAEAFARRADDLKVTLAKALAPPERPPPIYNTQREAVEKLQAAYSTVYKATRTWDDPNGEFWLHARDVRGREFIIAELNEVRRASDAARTAIREYRADWHSERLVQLDDILRILFERDNSIDRILTMSPVNLAVTLNGPYNSLSHYCKELSRVLASLREEVAAQ